METIEDINRERAERTNRAALHDHLVEDVRASTALLTKLDAAEQKAAPQGAALERIIQLARALPADLPWEGHLMGGRCADGLVAVAGSALQKLNQHASRRKLDRENAEKKLRRATQTLKDSFAE